MGRRAVAGLACLALLVTCQRKEVLPSGPPLPVEVAGCSGVRHGPVCELAAATKLTLWVAESAATAPEIRRDGERVALTPERVLGGFRFTVPVEPGQREKGELDEAERVLTNALPTLSPEDAARARSLLARVELSRGKVDAAIEALQKGVGEHRGLGNLKDAALDGQALAFTLTHRRGAFTEARSALAQLTDLEAVSAEIAATDGYYAALVASEAASAITASALFAQAEERSERLNLTDQLNALRLANAGELARLGRYREARDGLLRIPAEGVDSCTRAALVNNLAWNRLAESNGDAKAEELRAAIAGLDEARRLFGSVCKNPSSEANTLVNLAYAQLRADRPAEALSWLKAVENLGTAQEPRLASWALDLKGRALTMQGDLDTASASFSKLAGLAALYALDDVRWRAELGLAKVALLRGKDALALDRLLACERSLEQELMHTPLLESWQSLLSDREEASRLLISVLTRLDRPAEAMAVARRSRARVLKGSRLQRRIADLSTAERARWNAALARYQSLRRSLDDAAVQDWRTPANAVAKNQRRREELAQSVRAALDAVASIPAALMSEKMRSRRNPELLVVFHPGTDGWWGFAEGDAGVTARRLGQLDTRQGPEELGAQLLEPFRKELSAAGRVVFLPYGELRNVDLHALPLDGQPLLATREVVYAMDLEAADTSNVRAERKALVVGDPGGDLPAARLEATAVTQALRAKGVPVTLITGSDAKSESILSEVTQATIMHFAGHGRFDGADGWSSSLVTASGEMQVGELMTLPSAPAWVVLSGCETARATEAAVEMMGVAQAFIVSGAEAVLASTRPVPDASSSAVMKALYATDAAGDASSLATVSREALLKLRDAGGDWGAYRVWVR